ncbi:MAG: N-acetylmuramidase family protein [Roseburia sp.]|nr:N-acetylmuramidase family protein [Roseburia sp.]
MEKLTDSRIAEIARQWGIPPAALLAVKLVESGTKSGFLDSGRPQILFEGHVFYKYLKANVKSLNIPELCKKYPDIIYPKWDRSKYLGGEKEWTRLEKARQINKKYANYSASWGMFQVMGFNYKKCNCQSVDELVERMSASQEQQLMLTLEFLKNTNLIEPLRKKQWATFARGYNGAGYAQNRYHIKLQNAYANYVKQFPD